MDEAREPDDRIEHIVREAEQGAQFEFNPAAWDAMEQKLDAMNPVPFSIWKIIFPLTGVALLLMVLLWPIGAQDRQAESMRKGLVEETEKAAQTEKVEEGSKTDETPATSAEPEPEAAVASDQKEEDNKENATVVAAVPGQRPSANTITTTSTGSTEPPATKRQEVSSSEPVLFADSGKKDEENQSADFTGGSDQPESFSGVEMIEVRWNPQWVVLPVFEPVFKVDSAFIKDGKPKPYFEKSRWAFSAMVSLDMSATGLDGFTDPGTMFGLGAEYYFAPNWSIQSGAAIAVKKYSALGSEYTIEGWGQGRIDNLESVLANCLVIDIPINIRKYFNTKKGNTWFASTGISSYLMLRENYNYDYIQNIPGWTQEWQVRNQNQHYLGILNLSFGYETPISKNLGLGVEPFVKLPLTGIGQGSVKFLSFGTVIAIKLRK